MASGWRGRHKALIGYHKRETNCVWQRYVYRRGQGHIMQRVEKQRKDVLARKALEERAKEGGRDSEGEAVCNCGVSWNHSLEPRIFSAWLCALFGTEPLTRERERWMEEGLRERERERERGQKWLRCNNQTHMMLGRKQKAVSHTNTHTHTHTCTHPVPVLSIFSPQPNHNYVS